jgi:hypothetical protein
MEFSEVEKLFSLLMCSFKTQEHTFSRDRRTLRFFFYDPIALGGLREVLVDSMEQDRTVGENGASVQVDNFKANIFNLWVENFDQIPIERLTE